VNYVLVLDVNYCIKGEGAEKRKDELPLRLGFHMPELNSGSAANSLLILGLRPPWFCAEQLPCGRLRLRALPMIEACTPSKTFWVDWKLMTFKPVTVLTL